jgi:hypothetical protein
MSPSSAGRFNLELWQSYVQANQVQGSVGGALSQVQGCWLPKHVLEGFNRDSYDRVLDC